MKVNEIKVTKRLNTGEYEFEEVSVVLECGDETDVEIAKAIAQTKKEIVEGLTEEIKEKEEANGKGKTSSNKSNKQNGKSAGKKEKGDDDEGSEDNESSDDQASDDVDDNSENDDSADGTKEDSSEESGDEDNEQETKPAKGGKNSKDKDSKEGGKKSFKRKEQHYDRSIEAHKQIFSRVLTAIDPDWKESAESKKLAKKVSEEVEGEPFLDGDGEVVASFKARVKKKFK